MDLYFSLFLHGCIIGLKKEKFELDTVIKFDSPS